MNIRSDLIRDYWDVLTSHEREGFLGNTRPSMCSDDDIRDLLETAIETGDKWAEENCVMALDGDRYAREVCEAYFADARVAIYERWKQEGRL